MIYLGDCLEVMKGFEDNSVDSIVTDPPYGIFFMGKKWDYDVPSIEIWKEALRVLKPGGHLLSFGGTRTYHRLAQGIEDAGFEIRDSLQWLFGSGFPKSLNISKQLDKMAGKEREVVGELKGTFANIKRDTKTGQDGLYGGIATERDRIKVNITKPATPEAQQWEGWGTALKPANEIICLARKPLSEKTIAQNVLKHGTGGINIDGCRVGTDENLGREQKDGPLPPKYGFNQNSMGNKYQEGNPKGRFPSNVILDEIAGEMLGEPSRFFYCAKSSKSERNQGLDSFDAKKVSDGRNTVNDTAFQRDDNLRKNTHPTIKPISLMEYLVKLITPPNGIVLDPFMGSGSTGVACKNLDFKFRGIEKNKEYYQIAEERLKHAKIEKEDKDKKTPRKLF